MATGILTPSRIYYGSGDFMPIGILAKREDTVSLASMVSDVKKAVEGKNCGAIITFTGIIRPRTHDGDAVDHLDYDIHQEAARKGLEDMAKALCTVEGVLEASICHKYGSFKPGEEVLYIVIATQRSDMAFDILRMAVNKVKHELPIWKKEFTEKGDYWVDID
jgi:molybdopterin synthase catalytic subunit